jgi:uncharacterized repeat protein (TIGR01451 family)
VTTPDGTGRRRRAALAATVAGALLLGGRLEAQVAGSIVPTGRQEYFVLGYEQHVWNMMQRVRTGEGGPAWSNGMNSVVSAVASADGQVVIYDHWEDGFEADPWAPGPGSTLVLGDGIAANGRACDYTNDPRITPCNGSPAHDDSLYRGTPITLNSDQGLASAGCTAGIRCTVPVNARGTATHFDGGDRLVTSGGPLALIHNQFPPPYPQIGGSTEVLPRQAFAGATSYYVPAGEDRYVAGGAYQMFQYTALNIVAFDDGTKVFINSPGGTGGTVSLTLDRGQHYTNCLTYQAAAPFRCTGGAIDGAAATGITVNAATKISSTGPIAILLFIAGDGTWATDFMPILPDLLHGNDYILPAPGDDPALNGGLRPLDVYAYNPDPVNAITVTASDRTPRTNNIALAPSSTVDYRSTVGDVPPSSTVRLTSNRAFWGLALHDHLGSSNDWGYSWLASAFLTNAYTVSFSPGVNNPATASASSASRTAASGDADCTIPPAGAGLCDTINRSPAFVSAALDNTLVKVDFDNDGLFDYVDTNSDDYPDNGFANDGTCATPAAPWNVPGLANCVYRIGALQSLRIYDYTDYDNTGTRVQATKPIAMAYGQDTDQATGPDDILDTGYTVYPLSQRFLDPVLVVGKTASPTVVSGATGGQTTFTITVRSYAFAPLTGLTVTDLLPSGLSAADYVSGSSLVTYPDLAQSTADPSATIDPPTGRTRLAWTLSPDTLGADQTLTVSFRMNIPSGAARTFANDTFASGFYGGRAFNAVGGADVVRTNISLTKLVTDDGAPEPGDVVTYTLLVRNDGGTAENAVTLTDPIPAGTTFVTGSITAGAPFAGTFSAPQNAVVWTAATFGAGQNATLTFQVRINPDTDAGTVLPNRGIYESNETPTFFSNETLTTVVGPVLAETKTIVGGVPSALHPLEVVTFEVQVRNTGAGAATSLRVTDALALSRTTYVPGSMQVSLNGAAFVAVTDAADADAGTLSGTTVQLLLASLAPSADVRFRFRAQVNAATGGQVMNNQATVSAVQVGTADTNLLQVPIVGDATVTGRVFRDVNANGSVTIDPGEPGIPNITVFVTDSQGVTQAVVTDASGGFTAVVPAGAVTVDVDDADPDFPPGSLLSTGNDPLGVTAVAGSTVAAPNIGYRIEPLTLVKTASPSASVLPGQTITYTVTLRNNSAVTQTGVVLTDTLPAGTSYLAGSAAVSYGTPIVRATEYYVAPGAFTGTTYDLPLALPLATDYFVIVEGSDGSGATDTTPSQDLVAVTDDPAGTGDLGTTGANTLRLTRAANLSSWSGVVKVVECLASCTTAGFRLLDVQRVLHLNAGVSGTDTSAAAWSSINQVTLFGGQNGSGCNSTDGNGLDHKNCHVRLFPSGTQTINWTRDTGGATSMATATSTVMVVQWGTQWTVQRRAITGGNAGGADVDVAGEYNTVAIASVARANTWVWGTGHTNNSQMGNSADGVILTLGNGVAQNASETLISAGANYNNLNVNFDVYALTHPSLRVSHAWLPSAGQTGLTATVAPVTEAVGNRIAVVYNSLEEAANNYPRPLLSARYASPIALLLERRRSTSEFASWSQGIDFSAFLTTANVACANSGATCNDPTFAGGTVVAAGQGPGGGYAIPPTGSLVFTYQAVVADPPPGGQSSVVNTATASSTQNPAPLTATATTPLVVPRVDVEPNNAGYANPGTTITFTHDVRNIGNQDDAYALTVTGERGWRVDLMDPDTGVVIASDTNADGVWDAGTPPSTGTLAPGASKEYQVRVWVPAGAPAGIQDTVRLRATSGLSGAVWDDAKDEITVLPSGTLGSVIVTPDNSGVVQAGSYTAYAHRVINNTLVADTFDLRSPLGSPTGVDSSQNWTNTIHWDTNGDGVYTPGTDLQIVNTAQLPPGGSQLIFVVVNAPGGTAAGTRDVSHITAWSRNDPTLFGAATDTSTVVTTPAHDLSGGGSRVVAPGDTAVYPGTIVNLGSSADRFEITVTASNLYGPEGDGLLHPTALFVDSDADGVPDLQVATDTNGDGTWDVPPPPAWDADGDGLPDVPVGGGGSFAYELRRPIDPNQKVQRDFVTLSSRSVANPATDPDNVTATWIFAALTRAGIGGLRVAPGEVAFATSTQSGAASFFLHETDDPTGATGRAPLHDQPVLSPVPDSITPILYTVATRPVERRFVMIEERETDGDTVWTGPFDVGDARLRRAVDAIERRLDESGVPPGPVRRARGLGFARAPRGDRSAGHGAVAPRVPAPGARRAEADAGRLRRAAHALKIEVARAGRAEVTATALQAAGLGRLGSGATLSLSRLGVPVPFDWRPDAAGAFALSFDATPLATDYADRAPYVVSTRGPAPGPTVPLTSSADPETPGFVRVEREALYVPSLPLGGAPWQWDLLFSGVPWPDPSWDPAAGDFDLPDLAPGAAGPVSLRLRVVGYTSHRHTLTATINGLVAGSLTFEGAGPATLEGAIAAEALRPTGNRLELAYAGADLAGSLGEPLLYLDYLDLAIPLAVAPRAAAFALSPYDPALPRFRGTEYLIVTHPLFRRAAQRIARLKEAEGLATAVVETDAAYDRFSGGVVEPRAVQALVRAAAGESGRLGFVLLVGDDSFDPLDHAGRGAPSFVPSLFARDSGWGLVPSENLYADLDDDGRPDLAIGRLPVRTADEAAAAADKVAAQAAALAAVGETHLAVADNSTETDAPFRQEAEGALLWLADGASTRWADLAQGPSAARAALLSGWQEGVKATHYFGHGGLTEWADEQVLTSEDVAALGASWRPTVLFTWACLSQYYLGVDGPSLNESLVLQPGGGALASFGPAGITAPAHQAPLAAHLYRALRDPGLTLGEAIVRAKNATLDERPGAREAVEGFHLFGDPALVLRRSGEAPR